MDLFAQLWGETLNCRTAGRAYIAFGRRNGAHISQSYRELQWYPRRWDLYFPTMKEAWRKVVHIPKMPLDDNWITPLIFSSRIHRISWIAWFLFPKKWPYSILGNFFFEMHTIAKASQNILRQKHLLIFFSVRKWMKATPKPSDSVLRFSDILEQDWFQSLRFSGIVSLQTAFLFGF